MLRISRYFKGAGESSKDAAWKTRWGGEREETEVEKADEREEAKWQDEEYETNRGRDGRGSGTFPQEPVTEAGWSVIRKLFLALSVFPPGAPDVWLPSRTEYLIQKNEDLSLCNLPFYDQQ